VSFTIYRRDGSVLFESSTADTAAQSVAEMQRPADLFGAYLSGADLFGAYLSGADLSGADLSGADLSGADLSRADLFGADLSGADLSGADLSRADLFGADLSRADLFGADLSGADLSGADLIDAGVDSRGYRWVAIREDDGIRIYAGCRRFTLAEAHQHWDGPHEHGETVAAECRARLTLIEALAGAKGWIQAAVEVPA